MGLEDLKSNGNKRKTQGVIEGAKEKLTPGSGNKETEKSKS
jgi:hypothetical protein